MAKNNSEFTVHVHGEDGRVQSIAPGEDFPSGVSSKNPYVTGKVKEDDAADEATTVVQDDDAPKRRPARKAASGS